jgi:hypothetical protein
VAREQRDPDERECLGQPDETQREGIVRQRVDLPPDNDRLDLLCQRGREQAQDEPPKRHKPKRRVRVRDRPDFVGAHSWTPRA